MDNSNSLEEWGNWITGQVVESITFNFTVVICIYEVERPHSKCHIRIECVFTFDDKEASRELNPLNPPDLCCLLGLLNRKVSYVNIEESGDLHLSFESGESIKIEPDPQYEAWQIRDEESNAQVICSPGGGLF